MPARLIESSTATADPDTSRAAATTALTASVLGFFVITLDAMVVNVALPDIRKDLGHLPMPR